MMCCFLDLSICEGIELELETAGGMKLLKLGWRLKTQQIESEATAANSRGYRSGFRRARCVGFLLIFPFLPEALTEGGCPKRNFGGYGRAGDLYFPEPKGATHKPPFTVRYTHL